MIKKLKEFWLWFVGKDRRRFIRLKAHHLLKYKVIDKKEIKIPLPFVRDISAGGLLFHTPEYIPEESIVELKILLPSHPQPIKVISRVIRVRPLKKVGGFEIGVEFLQIEEKAREFINKRILKAYGNLKGGGPMKALATIFLILAGIGAIVGFIVRFIGVNFPVAPISWIMITNMLLLFSIALTLLIIAQK